MPTSITYCVTAAAAAAEPDAGRDDGRMAS